MAARQKKYTHQRSILKNTVDHSREEQEILEAKKQLILRRRRLFSHYRQYEQWRRRQFSYDPSYFRANPLPIGQAACGNYYSNFGVGAGTGAGVGAGSAAGIGIGVGVGGGAGAFRRRRQYRRQYSCADRSREGSRESRDSTILQKYQSMASGSDTLHTGASSSLVHSKTVSSPNYQYEHVSFDSSELHRFNSRHFQMLHEERSTSISERCTRSRINSAIFVSAEGRGFDSIEFLRRHGSQSVLCRKARSAENITDNDRKKSFSEQRQWRASEEPGRRGSNTAVDIELKECRSGTETRVLSVFNSNADQTTAVTTAANLIVGSISIEAPPSNIFDDTNSLKSVKAPTTAKTTHASIASTASVSHDSADTVEELIQIPSTSSSTNVPNDTGAAVTTSSTTATITNVPSPVTTLERKSRTLVRQRSSTASPIGFKNQSTAMSVHVNPKPLNLKSVKPKVIANLPMVSVSGPSPQEEKPECL